MPLLPPLGSTTLGAVTPSTWTAPGTVFELLALLLAASVRRVTLIVLFSFTLGPTTLGGSTAPINPSLTVLLVPPGRNGLGSKFAPELLPPAVIVGDVITILWGRLMTVPRVPCNGLGSINVGDPPTAGDSIMRLWVRFSELTGFGLVVSDGELTAPNMAAPVPVPSVLIFLIEDALIGLGSSIAPNDPAPGDNNMVDASNFDVVLLDDPNEDGLVGDGDICGSTN